MTRIRLSDLPPEVREVCEAAIEQQAAIEVLPWNNSAHREWLRATDETERAARRLRERLEEGSDAS